MRTMLATVLTGTVLAVAAALSGCIVVAAGAAGAAGYAFVAGNATGTVEATPDRVEAAAIAVFAEMEMELKDTDRDEKKGVVVLHAKGPNEPVKVTIRQEGEVSRLWVRVGRTGDEEYSRTVFDRIVARL